MKITHPVKGYNGHVRVGDQGFHFLAGVTHRKAKDIPAPVRASMEEAGFEFIDERRQDTGDVSADQIIGEKVDPDAASGLPAAEVEIDGRTVTGTLPVDAALQPPTE